MNFRFRRWLKYLLNYLNMLKKIKSVFQNLLTLIESEVENFDHTSALTCCLKLTRNLSQRVTVRRVASMCPSIKEVKEKINQDPG